MEKIIIGLTTSAIDNLITHPYNLSTARSRLDQHKILLSKSLICAYKNFFSRKEAVELFNSWVSIVGKTDNIKYYDDYDEDKEVIDILSFYQINNPHHIIVFSEEERFKNNKICFISLSELDDSNCDNELAKYCIPYCAFIKKNAPMSVFEEWIANWLKAESEITIIDRYFCKKENTDLLCKMFLPLMPTTANIHIYNEKRYEDQKLISTLKGKFGKKIHMHPSDPKDFHDRYIFCPSFCITIGKGIDVFDFKTKKATMETKIVVDGQKPTLPKKFIK